MEEAEGRCWDPDVSEHGSHAPALLPTTTEPLAKEAARGAALRRLRLNFAASVRSLVDILWRYGCMCRAQ